MKFVNIIVVLDVNVSKLNVFEEFDRFIKVEFYFYGKISIVCLDLLYVIRSLLEFNEGYLFIIIVVKLYFWRSIFCV